MLALIAGTGDLPAALLARVTGPVLVCAMRDFTPAVLVDISFRIEHLGSFLDVLIARGVTEVCLAGAVRRPSVDPACIDAATVPLVPRIQAAIDAGDDGALRVIMAIFEERGLAIRSAHEIAPDLLPGAGVLTRGQPEDAHRRDARVGVAALAAMGAADSGQACIVRDAEVAAREGPDGTDAMLQRYAMDGPDAGDLFTDLADGVNAMLGDAADWLSGPAAQAPAPDRGILFKGPKPAQDRRADLPVIGPETARNAVRAGLDGIVIVAGGVIVLDLKSVLETLDAAGLFLWVRREGGA